MDDDDELVRRVVHHDSREAYGELVRRHQAAVRSTLQRFTRDRVSADDLAQDTFLRAYEHIHQYTPGRSFRAWIGGIAYREFLKNRRREKTARGHLDALAAEARTASEQLDSTRVIDLDRALTLLMAEERVAVILSYGFGMTHGELATAMNAPLGTVKSWVNRGRRKLTETLSAGKQPPHE